VSGAADRELADRRFSAPRRWGSELNPWGTGRTVLRVVVTPRERHSRGSRAACGGAIASGSRHHRLGARTDTMPAAVLCAGTPGCNTRAHSRPRCRPASLATPREPADAPNHHPRVTQTARLTAGRRADPQDCVLMVPQGKADRGTRLPGSPPSRSPDDEHDQHDRRHDNRNRRQHDHKMREAGVVHAAKLARSFLTG
jgi:hypothetical protein